MIKEVNGIKIAILAYAMGLLEWNDPYSRGAPWVPDLDEERMKARSKRRSKRQDINTVMPHEAAHENEIKTRCA